jgi:hypothetical protein
VFAVLESKRLNACALGDPIMNAVTSMIEAKARRILESIKFLFLLSKIGSAFTHTHPERIAPIEVRQN